MQEIKDLAGKIQTELQSLTSSVSDVVQNFTRMQEPDARSKKQDGAKQPQIEEITEKSAAPIQQTMERVENLMKITDDIVQEIGTLRKALPATYFKNRSKIRDTVNAIEEKALQNLEEAFAAFDALQLQDSMSQRILDAAARMEEIKKRLHQLLELFEGKEDVEETGSYL
ncbi:MAG TPA: hypothetical protein ENO22_13430 [candidate division Zixibacteria bacterium]|nr:hypothetical protein [candidate division Zixibacteria bacterium]